ncbi:MAG: hypothetical protein A2W91_02770 [Bacteroidetes bacterium GWF2_38_335]|nr:MAG: hypothetical protein A2W91_02770 [Bacteroidetes bacterium GWF2_38_335]OFY77583.1 MAG: hypothetical protein A2281_01990 [Bacteroidetes bacterium RIFOXYA12_FULL_38_20]HBS87116.1 hypothetical protein [Bacteroidales bacterium]
MKKVLSLLALTIILIISSCGSKDANDIADIMCEIKAQQADLQKAMDDINDEEIEAISKKIEKLNSQLKTESDKLEAMKEENPEEFKKTLEDIISALESCEHYTKEEIEEIKSKL